jgi:hypothetical protein
MKTLTFAILLLGLILTTWGSPVLADDQVLTARASQCDGSTPVSESNGSRKFRITCLKTCPVNGKTEYLYLVEDIESKFGKNNDQFRFKIIQSPLWAGFRGPYGEQRILNRSDGLKCTADRDAQKEVGKLDFSGDGSESRKMVLELLKKSAECGEKEKAKIKVNAPRPELNFGASQTNAAIQASCPGGSPTNVTLTRDKIKESGKGNFEFAAKKGVIGFSCKIKNDLDQLKSLASSFLSTCDGLKSTNQNAQKDSIKRSGFDDNNDAPRNDEEGTPEP